MAVVGNTDDNVNSNCTALLCLCRVSSVMTDPPHWNGSISELRGLWPHHYRKTAKTSPSLLTWTILHVEEAGPQGHSLIAVLVLFSLVKGVSDTRLTGLSEDTNEKIASRSTLTNL